MMNQILYYYRTLKRNIKAFGFLQTFIYALFRMHPVWFSMVVQRLNVSGSSHPSLGDIDYKPGMDSVLHYQSWQEYGGTEMPKKSKDKRPCYIWFVPDWENVWGGGHYTLFRFAQQIGVSRNARQIIFVYHNLRHETPDALQLTLDGAIKDCMLEVVVDPKQLPACDAALATTWQSAYWARAFPFAKKKFYFMQDYESLFYAHGTASMQANNSYEFGFTGITGGQWLKSQYISHGGVAQNYLFAADKNIFYPAQKDAAVRPHVKRLFFYGRPSTERRCFELGMTSLSLIAKEFPDVEIVIAGLKLNNPPPFPATLMGNMPLADTGELYRTCDLGLAFSGTNLSYLPVELMACGVPVITNRGPHVEWHCKHNENAYLAEPTPEAVLEAFRELYNSQELRQKLASGGVATMKNISWQDEIEKVAKWIDQNLTEQDLAA